MGELRGALRAANVCEAQDGLRGSMMNPWSGFNWFTCATRSLNPMVIAADASIEFPRPAGLAERTGTQDRVSRSYGRLLSTRRPFQACADLRRPAGSALLLSSGRSNIRIASARISRACRFTGHGRCSLSRSSLWSSTMSTGLHIVGRVRTVPAPRVGFGRAKALPAARVAAPARTSRRDVSSVTSPAGISPYPTRLRTTPQSTP